MKTVLWWGRSDPDYSRNKIILSMFENLGWRIDYFHPFSSLFGSAQALFQRPKTPDLIWVPCFRQRDMMSAVRWARKWKCPIVFDPLISAYQKEVFEKVKWRPADKPAAKLHRWEARLFQYADLVIADTDLHAEFYTRQFGLDPNKVAVVYVGADEELFKPHPLKSNQGPLEVLFYGSYLALHGPEVIIDAAATMADEPINWVLLGEGDSKTVIQNKAAKYSNISFEPWINYERLPERMAQADIVLGIFGTTPKASMVIPNKVYQTMAMGKPLITRPSEAYPKAIASSDSIGWVPAGDAHALAGCVRKWAANPEKLALKGDQTYDFYQQYFSNVHLVQQLQKSLGGIF